MVIKLRCPQGHKVTCPDDRVGQSGKCPKCGSRFTVPDPKGGQGNGAATEDIIVFLCPNGHKLNGPSSLQGRPGQCPHCNARFLIPQYEDDGQEYDTEAGQQDVWSEELEEIEDIEELESIEPLPDDASGISGPDEPLPSSPTKIKSSSTPHVDHRHPLANVFEGFWAQRSHGGIVEVHLRNGEVIAPSRYAIAISRQDHAVFALDNEDGTKTLTAVAWDAVARVSVKGIKRLPAGMFDR